MRRTRLSFALAAVLAAGAAGLAAQRSAPAGEWRYYAGSAGSIKYSALDQINRSNVNQLQIAWRWPSPDNDIVKANPTSRPGGYQDTPLMVNGVLYTVTSLGQFAALDPSTGRTIWQFDPGTWKLGRPPNLGFTHRGMAYWTDGRNERLISGTHDAYLVSIDARDRKADPAFGVNGRVDAAQYWPSPSASGTTRSTRRRPSSGTSSSSARTSRTGRVNKEAPRGDIYGYDVRTGKKLWTFRSMPQPGEFGHDTWEDGSAEYTGGTNVWSMLTVDEELGYVYLPFGTPTNDYYGGHRLGNNLFAESLVCLDVTTGKRVWHFQGVHHGLWDYDFPAAPILADITVAGSRSRPSRRSANRVSSTSSIDGPACRSGRSKNVLSRSRR